MGTVNGCCAGGGGGLGDWGDECSGRWGKTSVQTFFNLFLTTFTEGDVTTEAGSLF